MPIALSCFSNLYAPSGNLQNDLSAIRDILHLAKYVSPTSEMRSNGNHHDVLHRQRSTKGRRPDKRTAKLWRQRLADGRQRINKRRKKPLGHLVRINQPFLKISLVNCRHLILKSANLKQPHLPVIMAKEKLAQFREQPWRTPLRKDGLPFRKQLTPIGTSHWKSILPWNVELYHGC